MQINLVSNTNFRATTPKNIEDGYYGTNGKYTDKKTGSAKQVSPPKTECDEVILKKTNAKNNGPVTTNTDDGDDYHLTPHIHGVNDDEDWNSGSEPFGKLLPLSIK